MTDSAHHPSSRTRRQRLALAGLTLALSSSLAVGSVAFGQSNNTYQNPILNEELADPSVLNDNGQLYVYGTGAADDDNFIPMSKLADPKDFNSWTHEVGTIDPADLPSWSDGGAWAPHVVRNPNPSAGADKKFLMFLSLKGKVDKNDNPDNDVVVDGKHYTIQGPCMVVAYSSSPTGKFKVQQQPLNINICDTSSTSSLPFGKIDPFFYVDNESKNGDGSMWLYWGSLSKPLQRMKVAFDNGIIRLVGDPQSLRNIDYDTKDVVPMRGTDPRDNNVQFTDLLEGSWLFWRAPYYYLMTSGYSCCNPDTDPKGYAVVVWRTSSLKDNAPWERMPEALGKDGSVLRSSNRANAAWESPGHNSLFLDGKGKWWIVYHARRPADPKIHPARLLMMDMLKWDNYWPLLVTDSDPDTPSEGPMPAPALPLPSN